MMPPTYRSANLTRYSVWVLCMRTNMGAGMREWAELRPISTVMSMFPKI